MASYSVSPAGEKFPLPGPEDDAREFARVQALAAAAESAAAAGYPVYRAAARLDGDATEAGITIATTLLTGAPGIYLWGGETTVRLPDHPGQGGRCQQLALAAAQVLAGKVVHFRAILIHVVKLPGLVCFRDELPPAFADRAVARSLQPHSHRAS